MPLLLASSSDLSAAMSLSAVYGFGHLAKDCRRWSASTMMMGASLPWHSAYDAPMASQQASLGGVEVVAVGVVGGVGRRRRRRWQRARSKDSGSGAPADQASLPPTTTASDFAHSSTVACCPHELDLLDVVLCEGSGTPTWVDPMLNELDASLQLAASLVINRSVGASALERPSTSPAASLGVQALLVDARSPLTLVQLSFADAEASGWRRWVHSMSRLVIRPRSGHRCPRCWIFVIQAWTYAPRAKQPRQRCGRGDLHP